MKRVTRDPIYRSKGQRSRSPGRLTPRPKSNHIFATARPRIRTSDLVYERSTMTHFTDVGGDLQAERYTDRYSSPLSGGGGTVWRPHYRLHSLYTLSLLLEQGKYRILDFTTVSQATSFHKKKTSICVIPATAYIIKSLPININRQQQRGQLPNK